MGVKSMLEAGGVHKGRKGEELPSVGELSFLHLAPLFSRWAWLCPQTPLGTEHRPREESETPLLAVEIISGLRSAL